MKTSAYSGLRLKNTMLIKEKNMYSIFAQYIYHLCQIIYDISIIKTPMAVD